MVVVAGIYPNKGETIIYDSDKNKLKNVTAPKVNSNDANKIAPWFAQINSTAGKQLECVCICLEPNYGNEIRKKFTEEGLKNGFKSIEIIDWRTAVFLNAISQTSYKLKNNDVIWIFTGYSYHVWQYKNQKIKHIFSPKGYSSKMDDLKKIKEKSKLNKDPNLVLFKHDVEKVEIEAIEKLPNCHRSTFTEQSYAEGALVKAQIMAKASSNLSYDVNAIFDQWITVKIEKIQLMYLKNFETLPFSKSIVIEKEATQKNLKVINHGIVDINPVIDICPLPNEEEISVTLSFDINGIYSVDMLPLDSYQNDDENKTEITHCIGVDFLNSEIAIFDKSTKQTSKQYLNKTSNISRDIEIAFLELTKIITFLSQCYVIFHIDDETYNHVLVAYHKACRKYKLKNFAFISTQAAELLNILNEHEIDETIKTVAFISDKISKRKIYCQIWKREGACFKADKSYMRAADPGADDKNLKQLKEDSKNLEGIDLVFIDSLIDENAFKAIFDSKYKVVKNGYSFAEAAMQKARILVADKTLKVLDVENNLNRRISVMVNNVQKCNFPMGRQLPFIEEINFENENFDYYKVCERNANGTKHETEYRAPAKGNWKLTVHCNINGILSTSYHLSETRIKRHLSMSKTLRKRINSLKKIIHLDPKTNKFSIPMLHNVNNESINAVGIDLGTSRCCAAVNRKNGITTVPLDNKGERLLPSYVSYDEEIVKCGQVVVDRLKYFEKSSIYDSKRIIGRKLKEIDKIESWPFTVTSVKQLYDKKDNDDALIQTEFENQELIKLPEEIAAALLKHIKIKIEEFQGKNLVDAVITIPATFNEEQKRATMAAAVLAGWETIHLLPEPIAAAFAYFIDRPIPNHANVLLFDLGGGTLDVCIFKVENDEIQILSKSGDALLGGRDFDDCLVQYYTGELRKIHGITEMKDFKAGDKNYKLILECQRIKEHLSVSFTEQLDIAEFGSSKDGFITITRNQFEALAAGLLERVKKTIALALQCLGNIQIQKVLLVGGGCRMPMIKQLLKEAFPKAYHSCEEHPDEVVAIGAAYYSYYLNMNQQHPDNTKEQLLIPAEEHEIQVCTFRTFVYQLMRRFLQIPFLHVTKLVFNGYCFANSPANIVLHFAQLFQTCFPNLTCIEVECLQFLPLSPFFDALLNDHVWTNEQFRGTIIFNLLDRGSNGVSTWGYDLNGYIITPEVEEDVDDDNESVYVFEALGLQDDVVDDASDLDDFDDAASIATAIETSDLDYFFAGVELW